MREISPAYNVSSDEFLKQMPPEAHSIVLPLVKKIRKQKADNNRPTPSPSLVDKSNLLTSKIRHQLIDKVALLVDENLFGRAEMCKQFSVLLSYSLKHLGLNSRPVLGQAIYYADSKEIFRWDHSWVRIGNEVVDGNVDILEENPMIPKEVKVMPYWGLVNDVPRDRMLRQDHSQKIERESDVEDIWWPELRRFIDTNIQV